MEILENPLLFVEYTVAVILATELIKKKTGLHPKWLSLLVGLILAAVELALRWDAFTTADTAGGSLWKLLISYCVANLFYDYVLRVIYDRFRIPR